jgi:type II secretory pathway pseudopilin PulG
VGLVIWGFVAVFLVAALMDAHDRARKRRMSRAEEVAESRLQERAVAWATQYRGFAFPTGRRGTNRGVPANKVKQPTR